MCNKPLIRQMPTLSLSVPMFSREGKTTKPSSNHQRFRYLKRRYCTLFSAILGVGNLPYMSAVFHTAHIGVSDSSILGTEMFGDPWCNFMT